MSKTSLVAVSALVLSVSVVFAQDRASKQKPKEFGAVLAEVGRNWDASRYSHCIEGLRELTAMTVEKRIDVVRAALPTPAGWKVQFDKKKQAANNAMLASFAVGVGTVVDQRYDREDDKARLTVQATIDSPLVSMMNMMFTNKAMLDGELVTYGDHRAVFKEVGTNLDLQILINEKHVVGVKGTGLDADALFEIFNQAAIDKIANALKD